MSTTVADLTNTSVTVNSVGHLIFDQGNATSLELSFSSDGHLISEMPDTYEFELFIDRSGDSYLFGSDEVIYGNLYAVDTATKVWDGSRASDGTYTGDYFEYEDFNRLNVMIFSARDLVDPTLTLTELNPKHLGELLFADEFNTMTKNLLTVAEAAGVSFSRTEYYMLGQTPNASELNAIEETIKTIIEGA